MAEIFAFRVIRLLTKRAIANELGPDVCWLLSVVVMQQDAIRYARQVTYYNEQLMPLCGFGSPKRLVTARAKAVESGWLTYQPGTKGVAGKYSVTIPDEWTDVPDGPCDEGELPFRNGKESKICRSDTEGNIENSVPIRKGKRKGKVRESGKESGHLSTLSLNPIPSTSKTKSRTRKVIFQDQDLATAKWMLKLLQDLNPNHKSPNFNEWANTIRLMRERDNRSDEEIRRVFQFANNDDFWKSNILSPAKLREKFDTLSIRAGVTPKPKQKRYVN